MSVTTNRAFGKLRLLVLTLITTGLLTFSNFATASTSGILPLGQERQSWSDIVFTGTTIGFDGNTLSISRAGGATQIEIGGEFGPDNPGTHYGNGGTLGGLGGGSPIAASFELGGVQINSSGIVTDGGTVTITYTGPPAGTFSGDLADDYGIDLGDILLQGTVTEVLLGATGTGTLDVLFEITGGALQTGTNSEPTLAGIPFAPNGLGLVRLAAGSPQLPADWTAPFDTIQATANVFGIPEPSSALLGMIGLSLVTMSRSSRRRARKTEMN